MAAECLRNCPRRNALSTPLVTGSFQADTMNFASLTEASIRIDEESVHCPGPTTEVIDVRKGIIHRTTVQEERTVCGLPAENPNPNPTPLE